MQNVRSDLTYLTPCDVSNVISSVMVRYLVLWNLYARNASSRIMFGIHQRLHCALTAVATTRTHSEDVLGTSLKRKSAYIVRWGKELGLRNPVNLTLQKGNQGPSCVLLLLTPWSRNTSSNSTKNHCSWISLLPTKNLLEEPCPPFVLKRLKRTSWT